MQSTTASPETEPPIKAYRVDVACKVLSISKRQLYRELAAGRLTGKKSGAITLIPAASVDAWLESLPTLHPTAQAA